MTVIAALADGRTVWMAADTATSYAGTTINAARKITRLAFDTGAQLLLAATGDGGIIPVAAKAITGASQQGDGANPLDPTRWEGNLDGWATEVAETITRALAEAIPPLTRDEGAGNSPGIDGSFLLAHAGRLWYLFTHQANPVIDGIAVLGVGADYALGWMSAAWDVSHLTGVRQERIVRNAVTATCARIPYCSAPNGPLVEILAPADEAAPADA